MDSEGATTGKGNCTDTEYSFKVHRPVTLDQHRAALQYRDRVVTSKDPWLRLR